MPTDRPNLLVFLTDDHGRWAAGCYGNRELRTPSLDHLAATGTVMERAFTPCPVCSPARASFLTGRIPSGHGIHDHIAELGVGQDHPGLTGQDTLAQRLQATGYRTGLVGKYHCNHFRSPPPGFDRWFTLAAGTNARFGPQPFIDQDRLVERHGHQAPYLTEQALRFLEEEDGRPWFLLVGYTDTHTPHEGSPERLVAAYRKAAFDDIPEETPSPVHGQVRFGWPHGPATCRGWLAQYYAAVTHIDEQVGAILDRLDSLGCREDTLVVYTGDHGHMNGHHGLHTKGNATIPQNLIDDSILVPSILSWPEAVSPGARRPEFVDHCDLFATLLDAAGENWRRHTEEARSPGRSFLPLLRGETQEARPIQFCEYGNARMARTETGKLIVRAPGPNGHFPDQFFDLAHDPRERVNAIGLPEHAEEVARLRKAIADHFARYEVSGRSGFDIARQPRANPTMPWEMGGVGNGQ